MKTVTNIVQSETQPFQSSVRAFLPQYAVVPFTQIKGQDYRCIVKENDVIQEGQVIAVPENESDKNDAVIHASIPGKVTEIVTCSLPDGKMCKAAKIHISGSFTYLGKKMKEAQWNTFSAAEIRARFAKMGVVNTFSETISLALQTEEVAAHKNRILVVRLFDDDPSRMTDSFVAAHYHDQIAEGAQIIAKAMNAEGIVFAVPEKKSKNDEQMHFDLKTTLLNATIIIDAKKYPSGFKQNLIQEIKHTIKNENTLFSRVNRKSLFIDPETALSAYEAVVLGLPVIERFVHVTGTCLRAAAVFKVRIGTTVADLAEQCGGFKIQPEKIIINGMVTGFAISSLDTPVTKQVKAVLFVPADELSDQKLSPCVRCGNCRRICPEGIFPDLIFRHQTGGKPVGVDLVQTAMLCSGCCLCNSVCPARLPLYQTIALMKEADHE